MEKEWREVSSSIFTFDQEKNRILEGVFGGWEPWTEGEFGACNRYFVEGLEGERYSFIGGTAFDKVFETANICVGDDIRVVYNGKKDLGDGRRVNLFQLFTKQDPKAEAQPKIVKPKGKVKNA